MNVLKFVRYIKGEIIEYGPLTREEAVTIAEAACIRKSHNPNDDYHLDCEYEADVFDDLDAEDASQDLAFKCFGGALNLDFHSVEASPFTDDKDRITFYAEQTCLYYYPEHIDFDTTCTMASVAAVTDDIVFAFISEKASIASGPWIIWASKDMPESVRKCNLARNPQAANAYLTADNKKHTSVS